MKYEPETRRVQLTGGATLIVSLPKEWTRATDLKPGDEVLVMPQPDLSLLVVPKKIDKMTAFEATLNVQDDLSNKDHLERILLSYYLAGYDVFKLNFDVSTATQKKEIKDLVRRKLTGVEVTEEGRNSLVMQNLIDIPDVKINDIVLKIIRALAGMLEDIRTALDTADKSILNDIIERDNEVDKFYWLLNRLLKRMVVSKHSMSLSGLKDPRNLLEYATINKSLERAADHVVEISYELLNMGSAYLIGIPKDVRNKLGEMTVLDHKLLDSISKAFLDSITLEEVNRIIDLAKSESKSSIPNIMNDIAKIEIDPSLSASIRTIINSLSRIGEYISDIGEAVINLTIERPS